MIKSKNKKSFINILAILALLILVVVYTFRCNTLFDEDYTLELVRHNFSNIVKLDSLDVHPPLYYFLLRIFLMVTTFWTKSLLIKVIFARIFSVIISIISFIFLYKLYRLLLPNNKPNYITQLCIFFMIPGVILLTRELIKIRMYSLGAMFVIIELYELIKYIKFHFKTRYLSVATLMAILSSYTHYYSAITSGTILLFFLLFCLIHGNKHYVHIIYAIIIIILAFIPWMPFLVNQMKFQSYHPLGGFVEQWIATLVLILIFMYPVIWSLHHLNKILNIAFTCSFLVTIILFVLMTCVSLVYKSVFQFRYFYSIYLIYGFIGINVLFIMCHNKNIIKRTYSMGILLILLISLIGSYGIQIKNNFVPSIQTIEKFDKWKNESNKVVHLNKITTGSDPGGYEIEEAMQLSNINKYAKFNTHRLPPDVNIIINNPSYNRLFINVSSKIKK